MSTFLKRFRSDRADGVLVLFLVAIPMFALILSFVVFVAESARSEQHLKNLSQDAALVAIKTVDARGSLTDASVQAFVNEMNRLVNEKSGMDWSGCEVATVKGPSDVLGNTHEVQREMPYMEVSLDIRRGALTGTKKGVWVAEGTNPVDFQSSGTMNPRNVYRGLEATVWVPSKSPFSLLGMGSGCHVHKIEISAIVFGSNEDTDTSYKPPMPELETRTLRHCGPMGGSPGFFPSFTIYVPDGYTGQLDGKLRVVGSNVEANPWDSDASSYGKVVVSPDGKSITYSNQNQMGPVENVYFDYRYVDSDGEMSDTARYTIVNCMSFL